jgi:glycyl-tRNA synthetase (class II)
VAEKVAEAAQNTAYYAKEAAKAIKNLNEKIERKARETKIKYQQAIRKEEFIQINKEIAEGSEKYNPHLVETTGAEFADGILLEQE